MIQPFVTSIIPTSSGVYAFDVFKGKLYYIVEDTMHEVMLFTQLKSEEENEDG